MSITKTHIYFVPGLAPNPQIFEHLKLPSKNYQYHYLEWLLPLSKNEPIENYSKRMADLVKENNSILIGVSFGGIMVQEMSKHLNTKKVIIISSVKSRNELPKRLKLIHILKAYKLFPAGSIKTIEDFSTYVFGDIAKKRISQYQKYLSVRDVKYLHWAIFNILNWKQKVATQNVLHIQGSNDQVFPIKYIKNCIEIKNGTHIMILNKAKSISKIISENI